MPPTVAGALTLVVNAQTGQLLDMGLSPDRPDLTRLGTVLDIADTHNPADADVTDLSVTIPNSPRVARRAAWSRGSLRLWGRFTHSRGLASIVMPLMELVALPVNP